MSLRPRLRPPMRPASLSPLERALSAAFSGGGGGPTPALSLDFTSSLPAQVTFTRAGTRTAIVGGVVTSLASGVPAIESWDGVNRGLSIDPASTNLALQSNNFAATWSLAAVTASHLSVSGPDGGALTGTVVNETTATAYHEVRQDVGSTSIGQTSCASIFIKALPGATTNGLAIGAYNQFGNAGARGIGMVDGSKLSIGYDVNAVGGGAATMNNVKSGIQVLANGWLRVWASGVATATGVKSIRMRITSPTAPAPAENYPGIATNGGYIAFAQNEVGVDRPTSYKATGAASASTVADSATITDLSWLNQAVGTFVVEHDVTSGIVLGSGTNTIISGTVAGKTAFAWSGSTSDLVNNGGSSTTGSNPTFGALLQLLANNSTTNPGHIKSLTYYAQRLSVAEMQALTAPASTAKLGVLRVVGSEYLPASALAIAGTTPTLATILPRTIQSGDRSNLRIVIGNTYCTDAGGDVAIGNTVNFQIALIRVATGEVVPVKFGGVQAYALGSGVTRVESDEILPSDFPSLAAAGKFSVGDQFQIKMLQSCASGGSIPAGSPAAFTGVTARTADGSVTTFSTVNAAGLFDWTGPTPGLLVGAQMCASPILVGKFVSGDPMTVFATGDSIMAGGSGGLSATGTWIQKACAAQSRSLLLHALGGQSQVSTFKSTVLPDYMRYARVLVDNMGTNSQGLVNYYPIGYRKALDAGIGYVIRPSIIQRSTSTDSFATNANQTALIPYPSFNDMAFMSFAAQGVMTYYKSVAARDTGDKWIVNGTASWATSDGTHPKTPADDLMSTELQGYLTAAAAALT